MIIALSAPAARSACERMAPFGGKVSFPVGRAEPEYHRHEGEEWLYVLSGRLRLTLGEEATVLEPGDAAFFDGMLPHAFDVLGEENVAVHIVAGAVFSGDRAVGRRRNPERLD